MKDVQIKDIYQYKHMFKNRYQGSTSWSFLTSDVCTFQCSVLFIRNFFFVSDILCKMFDLGYTVRTSTIKTKNHMKYEQYQHITKIENIQIVTNMQDIQM